jgi:hypothetical protein
MVVACMAAALWACLSTPASAQPARSVRRDLTGLGPRVDGLLREHGDGVTASVWVGGADGPAWFERLAIDPRATASAIKTFYLVELFDTYAGQLDRPLPGIDAVLRDDSHPAISHFTPEQRDEIRRGLTGIPARQVGLIMMGSAPASNVVYNAAANVTTVALGGPEALTRLIRMRDPAFGLVSARRYMLRNRREHGDNEAPALALAVLYQRLASRSLAGIDAPTMDAIVAAVRRRDDPALGRHYDKGGSLDTDPMCEVRAGWYDTAKGRLVYVAMTLQPAPGAAGRAASSQRLARTADAVADALVQAGWTAIN